MSEKNPIEKKIVDKQDQINKDVELKKNKGKFNLLVTVTSILLMSGVIMRLIMVLFKLLR